MSKLKEMEARGLGSSDVREVERYLTRLQSQKEARWSATSRSTLHSKVVSTTTTTTTSFTPEPSDPQRLLQSTEMKLTFGSDHRNSSAGRPQTTPGSARIRSADPNLKRQMAITCGLKSVPLNDKKWPSSTSSTMSLPPSRMANKDPDSGRSTGTTLQSQVLLLNPEENANVRKGLSGSMIRPGARTPRRDSRTPRFDLRDSDVEHREGSILISASPRAQSIRYCLSSVSASGENENSHPLKSGTYKWNSSDQGVRLHKNLTSLNTTRVMKRASEMVQHRLDPMYLMSGNKLKLQQRYGTDDSELQEMKQIKQDMMSDLKKMKYPYGAKAQSGYAGNSYHQKPSHSNVINQSQSTFLTNPRTINQLATIHPTPTSELESAREVVPKYRVTNEPSREAANNEENVYNYYDDEINSWNGPL